MRLIALLLFCAIVVTVVGENVNRTAGIELTAPIGKIRGSFITSRLGRQIYSFRGLRYAEAPVGERRFKQAVPVARWNNIFDASQEGPSCPQPGGRIQSEDCLRLNVYSTKLPTKRRRNPKRPVIVFFHPGGFYSSSGQSFYEGPHLWLDQDIVLVVVNYRLGSLGFLSTGDELAPGNLGLKDQVEALRWVKKNIASFGGNPNCVTITGYSAGAWSVSLHLLSPMSKGLFHRAISMSGSSVYQTPLQRGQKNLAVKQAKLLNCPTDSTANILACLNTKTAQQIGDSLPGFAEWYGDPVLIWAPVIEPEVPGVERFLHAQPADLIRQGKFEHVPFITGICKDEFGGVVVSIVEAARAGNLTIFKEYNENWEKIAPISFLYERDTPRSKEISRALKQFYFKGQPISLANIQGLADLYADGLVGFNVHSLVNLMGQNSRAPVYYYDFIFQGRYSHVVWNDTKKPYGVVHHDDLLYLFYGTAFPWFEEGSPEIPTVERMTAMWSHFANTGVPIPRDNPIFANVIWEPFTAQNKKYLEIGNELIMKTNLHGDRMDEWDRLFPLPPIETQHPHPAGKSHVP